MTISSRTPEGDPNVCSVCGHDLRIEPSLDTRDGPCPRCGHLLWFPERGRRTRRRPKSFEALVIGLGKGRLGPFPAELQVRLIKAISAHWKRDDLPREADLRALVAGVPDWGEFVALLERCGRVEAPEAPQARRPIVKSAVSAIVARAKKLFAGR